jgi:pantothenate kinase type III
VLELVFGAPVLEGEDPSTDLVLLSKKQALACALSRRIPVIQVYVVSTSPKNEHGLAFLLQELPVQVFRLRATDFFSTEQGAYPTLGVDRAATAKAAMSLTGVPALVLDGGTALTYTGVDVHGNLEGGGITPGLQLQFRALSEGTGALPYVSPQQVVNTVQRCKKQKKPLELMARNTKEAIMCAILRETAAHVGSIVASWQDKAQAAAIDANHNSNRSDTQAPLHENAQNIAHKINTELAFLVCGGDGTILTDLLAPLHSHIVPPLKFSPHSQGGYASQAKSVKHLIHHGIRQLLTEKQFLLQQQEQELARDDQDKNNDTRMVRESLLGLRVVRNIVMSTTRGEDSPVLQQQRVRGTVEGVKRGDTLDQDKYRILYDDKAREELTVAELYGT